VTENQRACRNPKCGNPAKRHRDFCSAQCARLIYALSISDLEVRRTPSTKIGVLRDYRLGAGQPTWPKATRG
jgi:hypothetical protein